MAKIVVIGNLSEEDPAKIPLQKQLAGYALTEIDRIISTNGRRFV
jgi:hypothetical protein